MKTELTNTFDPRFIRKLKELTGADSNQIESYLSQLNCRSEEVLKPKFIPRYLKPEHLYLAIKIFFENPNEEIDIPKLENEYFPI
ncbi:hypothetical protein IT400_00325 [Candidatus Nomurabacteria bacterium]|nr:hypothetical protein [Candidatus Nomurabacteria bacterium]